MKLTTIKIQKQKLERWRDIEGYEGLYRISSLGRVKSLNYKRTEKEKILKLHHRKDGYLAIGLSKNGKRKSFKVHRLVANAFIPNVDNKSCIDHINTIKTDNRVCNLRWVTTKENNNNPLTLKKKSKGLKEHYVNMPEEERRKISKRMSEGRKGEKNGRVKKVRCIETGEIFNTVTEASEWCGLKSIASNIASQIRGRQKSAGKHPVTNIPLHWEYVD